MILEIFLGLPWYEIKLIFILGTFLETILKLNADVEYISDKSANSHLLNGNPKEFHLFPSFWES
jgi:hypothetical protein